MRKNIQEAASSALRGASHPAHGGLKFMTQPGPPPALSGDLVSGKAPEKPPNAIGEKGLHLKAETTTHAQAALRPAC